MPWPDWVDWTGMSVLLLATILAALFWIWWNGH